MADQTGAEWPKLALESSTISHRDCLVFLQRAIGEHYDVRLERQRVRIEDWHVLREPVLRIYDKGGRTPLLSFWLP